METNEKPKTPTANFRRQLRSFVIGQLREALKLAETGHPIGMRQCLKQIAMVGEAGTYKAMRPRIVAYMLQRRDFPKEYLRFKPSQQHLTTVSGWFMRRDEYDSCIRRIGEQIDLIPQYGASDTLSLWLDYMSVPYVELPYVTSATSDDAYYEYLNREGISLWPIGGQPVAIRMLSAALGMVDGRSRQREPGKMNTRMTTRTVKMEDEQWDYVAAQGGAGFVRDLVDAHQKKEFRCEMSGDFCRAKTFHHEILLCKTLRSSGRVWIETESEARAYADKPGNFSGLLFLTNVAQKANRCDTIPAMCGLCLSCPVM